MRAIPHMISRMVPHRTWQILNEATCLKSRFLVLRKTPAQVMVHTRFLQFSRKDPSSGKQLHLGRYMALSPKFDSDLSPKSDVATKADFRVYPGLGPHFHFGPVRVKIFDSDYLEKFTMLVKATASSDSAGRLDVSVVSTRYESSGFMYGTSIRYLERITPIQTNGQWISSLIVDINKSVEFGPVGGRILCRD